jgi:hypothetical protein
MRGALDSAEKVQELKTKENKILIPCRNNQYCWWLWVKSSVVKESDNIHIDITNWKPHHFIPLFGLFLQKLDPLQIGTWDWKKECY